MNDIQTLLAICGEHYVRCTAPRCYYDLRDTHALAVKVRRGKKGKKGKKARDWE